MITLRRFLVVQALLLWQGGFLFYAAVVVPTGTELLGSSGQGAITARVTDALNAIGFGALALLALDVWFACDPNRRRVTYRWAVWGFALACQCALVYLHLQLDALMDGERRHVTGTGFYATHRVYLWVSCVQWVAYLLLTWLTLRAWRDEDRGAPFSTPLS